MFDIFARSFSIATYTDRPRRADPVRRSADLPRLSWLEEDLEPVWPETMERFCAAVEPAGFRRAAFAPSYGLAEATLLVSTGKASSGPRTHVGVVDGEPVTAVDLGTPVRGVTVRLLDPDGNPVEDGDVGEIEISGPCVGRPVDGRTIDDAGRVMTGDLGFLVDGALHVTGRRKELIILRGQNVYPADIENAAVRAHELVPAGGVAAIPLRADGTESLAVLFEAKRPVPPGDELERICAVVREGILRATGQVPAAIAVVPWGKLPRTTSGKIKRTLLVEQFTSGDIVPIAGIGRLPITSEAVLS